MAEAASQLLKRQQEEAEQAKNRTLEETQKKLRESEARDESDLFDQGHAEGLGDVMEYEAQRAIKEKSWRKEMAEKNRQPPPSRHKQGKPGDSSGEPTGGMGNRAEEAGRGSRPEAVQPQSRSDKKPP